MDRLLCEHEWNYIEQKSDSLKELVCEENKIIDARPKFIVVYGRFDEASPWITKADQKEKNNAFREFRWFRD